tara:strand:- start:1137 stop:1361 length:225 start_codon:yes stop_codon:yes gene_type:complete
MKLHKVKNQTSLSRNIDSNSIVNTDTKEFNKYMKRRQVRSKGHDKMELMESDLSRLKGEINEIKNLLKELVNGK